MNVLSAIKIVKIKISNLNARDRSIFIRCNAVLDQSGLIYIWYSENLLCLVINVNHYKVEHTLTHLLNVLQCVDMALIQIYIHICWELCDLVFSGVPLIECCIQLTLTVSAIQITQKITYTSCSKHNYGNGNLIIFFSNVIFICWEQLLKTLGKRHGYSSEKHILDNSDDLVILIRLHVHYQIVLVVLWTSFSLSNLEHLQFWLLGEYMYSEITVCDIINNVHYWAKQQKYTLCDHAAAWSCCERYKYEHMLGSNVNEVISNSGTLTGGVIFSM